MRNDAQRDDQAASLPRILIIDDLFGRNLPDGRNQDRENICASYLWRDVTGDAAARASRQQVARPLAEAVFFRGQTPVAARPGDTVENDLDSALAVVASGWRDALAASRLPWAMLLLDLCFYTGRVTAASDRSAPGMPEQRAGDDQPSGYFGLVLLDAIHRRFPQLPIFIMSSKPREEISHEFVRHGALGFIARDDPNGLAQFEQALRQHGLIPDDTSEFLGSSLAVLVALRDARRASHHRANLLIRGERGSGKDVLAHYAHRMSTRMAGDSAVRDRPFVAINSATLQSELFSAELFGIEPKTASGVDGRIGFIEAASRGDLFLDEIADMPAEGQAALLRVMQDRRVTRIGSRNPIAIDVRFLSATNVRLEDAQSGFREDLLDRLRMGGTLWLPPLRDRASDIPMLAARIVAEAEAARPGTMRREIGAEALAVLAAHPWPGNVRELRSALLDAVYQYPDVEHLVPSHLRLSLPTSQSEYMVYPAPPVATARKADRREVDRIIDEMEATRFDNDASQWSGKLGPLQRAQARLQARYLQAALNATKRRTVDQPEGIVQIHPAMKLISGDARMSASAAADAVKRILGPLQGELDGDLAQAMAVAVKLRPKSIKIARDAAEQDHATVRHIGPARKHRARA